MNVIYSNMELSMVPEYQRPSLFLAGPTPRDRNVPSWRPRAIEILASLGYTGDVYVPERNDKTVKVSYDDQVEWENTGLLLVRHIVFWIPRDLITMPAFTTNVEFGRFARESRTFYGRPDDAPKNRYLDWYYNKVNFRPIYNNLTDLLKATII